MIWAVVWVEQFENLELLGMQFQPYGPSKKVTTVEETRFPFDHLCRNDVRSLFGFQSSSSSNSHVPLVSCHNLVRLSDASCWPTTRGGMKVRRPSMFKITQLHTTNWEAGRLLLQCIVFPDVDVPPLGYGQIYKYFFWWQSIWCHYWQFPWMFMCLFC